MTRERATRRQVLRAMCAGGAVSVGTTGQGTAQSGESWPQFGYDQSNDGHAPDNTGPTGDVGTQWDHATLDSVDSSPAVADGTVYVGSADGAIYALNAADGTERWTYRTGEAVTSSPAVAAETVYVGSKDATVYALDAADGTEQWTYRTGAEVDSSPTAIDGTVYVGSDDSNIYALNADEGTERWTYRTGGAVTSSPAVTDGTVYFGSWDSTVYALDAADGTEQWTYPTGDQVWSSPAVADGTVYVGSKDATVYALDADEGTEQWTYRTAREINASPAVADGTVYVGNWDAVVYALDAADGTEQWTYRTGGAVNSSPAVVDGTVYVGSGGFSVHAIDAADGTEQWTHETDAEVNASPAVVDGTVYVGSADTTVYALGRTTGESGSAILPVIAGLAGLTGIGGLGAWAYRRRGDSVDSASSDTSSDASVPGSPTSPDSGTPTTERANDSQSPDADDTLSTVERLVAEGDDRRADAATAREGAAYRKALTTYDEARDAYEQALDAAGETSLVDTGEIEAKLESLDEAVREVHARQLDDRVAAIRSDLDDAASLADAGDLDAARSRLEGLASRIDGARRFADDHGLDDRREAIDALEERRRERLAAVTDRLEARPIPETIPRVPDVDVDYEALTDREPIGGGGSADVVRATMPTPDGGVTLAIKEPRLSGTLHTGEVERLLGEAETWDRLDDHDHVVGVVDYGSDPIPWIAMEYMDAGHLGERVGDLDLPQALWTAIAITKGVRHAHRRGVAHLDLKPKNVLFRTVEGAWDVPKVADWGLSKHLLDHSESVEGLSPQYAAPEQFTDDYGPTDDITDVYQLGAVCYELFTGTPPFEGDPAKAMHQVLNDPPTPPSERADVPEALDEILLTALAKEKADRYDTVVYLRDELQALFDEQ